MAALDVPGGPEVRSPPANAEKIPRAMEQLHPGATTAEPHAPQQKKKTLQWEAHTPKRSWVPTHQNLREPESDSEDPTPPK